MALGVRVAWRLVLCGFLARPVARARCVAVAPACVVLTQLQLTDNKKELV